tara:strand:+ start:1796 stop:2560 length:765 start_codon:yes stop_codon:yes gene_type:complete
LSDGEDESKENFPLPPPPPGLTIPPLPTPPPPQDIATEGESGPDLEVEDSNVNDDFNSAWAKRRAENPDLSSDKRDQMYGHIDRIATGEVGTLLDRFSDRFGSELDREIIVLRKKQQKEMRDIKPTVEIISSPETDYEEEVGHEEELDDSGPEIEPESTTEEDEEDQFVEFFSVVNDLLGSMPDDFVNSFVASDDFSLFQSVGDNPSQTDEDARKGFFSMINRVLGDLPDDKINEFVQSPGFAIFQLMGELYGD